MTDETPGPVEVELKPCPFCGGGAALVFSRFELHCGHHVVCHGKKDCPLYCSEPYRAFDSAVEAITAWNTRHRIEAARPVQSELVEAIAELQLAAFLAGRGSIRTKDGGRTVVSLPGPTMDDYRRMAEQALSRAKATGDGL